jgi:hypothetical protein
LFHDVTDWRWSLLCLPNAGLTAKVPRRAMTDQISVVMPAHRPKTVRVHGGLGNQLFCLAFARSVALLSGAPVALDVASYAADSYGRHFDLTEFARDLGDLQIVRRPWLGSRPRRLLGRLIRTGTYVVEGTAPAGAAALGAMVQGGGYFDGYWQNEAFILDLEGFRNAFRREIARRVTAKGPLSTVIHYRTYKEERSPRARATPGPDFFRRALRRIAAERLPGDVFLVSDDPDLALARLGDIGTPVQALRGGGPWDDMAIMVAAQNLILTNSSFSWWGGICADAAKIFYPANQGFAHYPWPASRFIEI